MNYFIRVEGFESDFVIESAKSKSTRGGGRDSHPLRRIVLGYRARDTLLFKRILKAQK